jgi:hypothetical protein
MWDFDADEMFFLVIAAAVGGLMAIRYYLFVIQIWRVPARRRWFWAAWPAVCLAPTAIVLNTLADPQVIGHIDYITLFLVGDVVWVFGAAALLPLVGVRMRDDVLERGNRAAGAVAAAAMLGGGLCYAGANIGVGPTIWTTIVPALLAAGLLAAAALVVRAFSPLADALAIDRDAATGSIFAAFLVAASLILAWAVEGNFVDYRSTLIDLARRGSGVILLVIATILALRIVPPRTIPEGGT